ncbi:MAG: ExeM/NucH family extracellular endonuclease, partial [bacterium]|nr:ExeM/NucH family extracellular endonuclease [bacterium]
DGTDATLDSNQRCANGTGGARNTDTYTQWAPSPGAENVCEIVVVDPVEKFIHEIQGAGNSVALPNVAVIVEGVVVGDFQDTDLNGFFLQEEDADVDSNPATSEGIYVFQGGSNVVVNLGDTVKVTGTAVEFFDVTEINNVTAVEVTGSGAVATPVQLIFPVADTNFENIEGMGVEVQQTMTIVEYFNFDRFGEIAIATDRQIQPTAIYEPGSVEAANLADLNARSRITLDDGQTASNPDFVRHPDGTAFTLANRFRGGDLLDNVVGVMHDSFGYRIHPTAGADYTSANPRVLAPESVGGDITVASFNVLNYYTTLDEDGAMCYPAMDQSDCRGADDAEEFGRQRAKIIVALLEIDADVVGLIEIENNIDDDAVIDLVAGLNAAVGAGTYDYVAAGRTGFDTIKVAFIYKPDAVSLAGAHAILETPEFLDPNNTGRDRNRAALAQTFTENATGESFTAVVNHFKSKGTPCGVPGDDDPETGSCNLTRTLTAQVLSDWLATDPTGSLDPDVLVLGDLNAYDKEDPIDVMVANVYTDLVYTFQGEAAYSYVFNGQTGYLDYGMANAALLPAVTGTTVWHLNSDEPDILDYDTTYKSNNQDAIFDEMSPFRSSDHDPVIIGLNLSDLMGDKEAVAGDLEALLPTGSWWIDRTVNRAIDRIEASLNPNWWDSDSTINNRRVFDRERQAVSSLRLVTFSSSSAAPAAQEAIDTIVAIDRQLAEIELIAAVASGGNAWRIARAEAALARGDLFASYGLSGAAINQYKFAWYWADRA